MIPKCKQLREGDEIACSCGLRWDADGDDPHGEVVDTPPTPRDKTEYQVRVKKTRSLGPSTYITKNFDAAEYMAKILEGLSK